MIGNGTEPLNRGENGSHAWRGVGWAEPETELSGGGFDTAHPVLQVGTVVRGAKAMPVPNRRARSAVRPKLSNPHRTRGAEHPGVAGHRSETTRQGGLAPPPLLRGNTGLSLLQGGDAVGDRLDSDEPDRSALRAASLCAVFLTREARCDDRQAPSQNRSGGLATGDPTLHSHLLRTH